MTERTFGPVIVQAAAKDSPFEAKCYSGGYDCTFRIGDTCTHIRPSRKIEALPETPDWCELKENMLRDAREMYAKQETPK